jgi:hypothetical protein
MANDKINDELSTITSIQTTIEWTSDHENILIEWADKALCYKWLHENAHVSYSRMNTWFTIPVIIMSTLTGTANFAQDRVPSEYINAYTMVVGAINITAGILTTIQQYLKISEVNESHRISSISWGKFYRNIKIELAKSPEERTNVTHLLKFSKEEYDRLIETSPTISNKIIIKFKNTFSGGEILYDSKGNSLPLNAKQASFIELKKPDVCDSLESTSRTVYKSKQTNIYIPNNNAEMTQKNLIDTMKKQQLIEDFIKNFESDKYRPPTTDEIINNLDHEIPIDIIRNILHNINSVNIEGTLYADENV